MFAEWKIIAFQRSSCSANSPLTIVREGLQRSDSRRACRRNRSPPATSTTSSGLTLLLTVWPGATQSTKLLPSSKRTEESHSKTSDRGRRRSTTAPDIKFPCRHCWWPCLSRIGLVSHERAWSWRQRGETSYIFIREAKPWIVSCCVTLCCVVLYCFSPYPISQSEANSTVLVSYDIKSLTCLISSPTISWPLLSKVMLPYDKLQRGFANKQTTRNLRVSWETLANCVDKYLNIQTETMEPEVP